MITRGMGYTHYGITSGEVKELLALAKEKENSALLKVAAVQSNADLADYLFISLAKGTSYDMLFKKYYILCKKDDFYGYRRRALCLFKMLLMCRDAGYLILDVDKTQ